ncbi:MAG: zinc ribbon domain-containing protein [Lachnospiraceae bacterium]|nr:zinc ribbon domain-containing protein [Lachnospiraceae bacterium]
MMKCPNCGFENDDLAAVCMNCGQDIPTKKQKKAIGNLNKNKKRRRIILLVLLAVVVCGGLFLGREYIIEFFLRTFSSSEDYTRHVLRKNFSGEQAAELYENLFFAEVEKITDSSVSGDLKLDLTSRAISDMEDESGAKDLDYLDNIVVEYEFDHRDDLHGTLFNLCMDQRDIAQFDAIYDSAVKKAYLRIPEMNGKYAGIDLSSFYSSNEMDMVDETLSGGAGLADKLPEPALIEKEWDRYLEALIAPIDDVDMEKENLKIEGVRQNLYAITIEFDNKLLADMLTAISDTAEEDEDLQKILVDISAAMGSESLDETSAADKIKEFAEKLRDDAQNIDIGNSDVELCLYVNAKGRIQAGRMNFDMDILGTNMKEEILVGYTRNFTNIGMTLSSTTDFGYGRSVNRIAGRGELGFGGLDATLTMDVATQSVDMDIEDLDVFALEKGNLKGKFSGKLLAEIFNADNYLLDVDMDKKGGMAKLTLKDGKKDYIDIDLTVSRGKTPSSFKIPDSDVSDISDLQALNDYVSECDFDAVLDNLKKAGVNGDTLDAAEDLLDMIKQVSTSGVFPQIYYWGLNGQLRKYLDKSKIAADNMLAEEIHSAFYTSIYDPAVINSPDYNNTMSELQRGILLDEHSPSDNTVLLTVADILDVDDFAELTGQVKSGGCTGIYVSVSSYGDVTVELRGTDDGYGHTIRVDY